MGERPEPPSPQLVAEAVEEIAAERNGYQAWALYMALLQGEVPLAAAQRDMLAGTMLHVDKELHTDLAARRTLSVLDGERQAGRPVSRTLLVHSAEACAYAGLPDLADLLCVEAEQMWSQQRNRRAQQRPQKNRARRRPAVDFAMRASLISAFGTAGQLTRAFDEYRRLSDLLGRTPPSGQCAVALVNACVDSGNLDAAFDLIDELKGQHGHGGFQLKAGALTPLLRGCAAQGDVERAREVLQLARERNVEVRAAAVRELSKAGSSSLLAVARELHRAAQEDGARMPKASTAELASALLFAGDSVGAAEVLGISRALAEGTDDEELCAALDLLQTLNLKQRQREQAVNDLRRQQRQLPLRPPSNMDDG